MLNDIFRCKRSAHLQLCKYNLEKKVKEQEKKLEMQALSGGLNENQLIEVEQLAARLKKRVGDLTRQLDRLQKNGTRQ